MIEPNYNCKICCEAFFNNYKIHQVHHENKIETHFETSTYPDQNLILLIYGFLKTFIHQNKWYLFIKDLLQIIKNYSKQAYPQIYQKDNIPNNIYYGDIIEQTTSYDNGFPLFNYCNVSRETSIYIGKNDYVRIGDFRTVTIPLQISTALHNPLEYFQRITVNHVIPTLEVEIPYNSPFVINYLKSAIKCHHKSIRIIKSFYGIRGRIVHHFTLAVTLPNLVTIIFCPHISQYSFAKYAISIINIISHQTQSETLQFHNPIINQFTGGKHVYFNTHFFNDFLWYIAQRIACHNYEFHLLSIQRIIVLETTITNSMALSINVKQIRTYANKQMIQTRDILIHKTYISILYFFKVRIQQH